VLSHVDPAWLSLAKLTASKAKKVTVDAECLKNIWINMGILQQKIEVIPFGVDINRFNPYIDGSDIRKKLHIYEEDTVVISTRPFYSHYDIGCLIRAIPSVLTKHKNTKFIVKGSGPLENHIKTLAEKLDVLSNVCFVGIVPRDEFPRYLSAADIYVSTCLVDSTSVSLLEAMACGLPPVVTDIPGNREWIDNEKNGLLYPPQNSKALAGKIIQLIEDEHLRESFGRKCVQIIKDRAMWEKCVSKMETIYKSLL
jgi:glycosyltransferase involved in cell wall biosynthesis